MTNIKNIVINNNTNTNKKNNKTNNNINGFKNPKKLIVKKTAKQILKDNNLIKNQNSHHNIKVNKIDNQNTINQKLSNNSKLNGGNQTVINQKNSYAKSIKKTMSDKPINIKNYNYKLSNYQKKKLNIKNNNKINQYFKNTKRKDDYIKIWIDNIDNLKKTRKNMILSKNDKKKDDDKLIKELLIKNKIIKKNSKAPPKLLKELYLNLNDLGEIQIV